MPDLKTASLTGSAGGRPHESPVIDKESLIEATALAIVAGKYSPKPLGLPGPITPKDHNTLARLTAGMSVEEFGNRVQERLREMADLTADRIFELLKAEKGDGFKPETLPYLYAVTLDKLARYEGRVMTAQTNVQINHFHGQGERSRDEILASIRGNSTELVEQV